MNKKYSGETVDSRNPQETIDSRNRPIRNPDSGVIRQKL